MPGSFYWGGHERAGYSKEKVYFVYLKTSAMLLVLFFIALELLS